jgi:UDP-N-acetylmuramyl pentapeptide phosphotransferase/UDP-N-acetylglucosamine-1-phosphate transferase
LLLTGCVALSLVVTSGLVLLLKRSAMAQLSLDHPNGRSLHEHPTPRIGGIAMAVAVAVTTIFLIPASDSIKPLLAAAPLALISRIDDRRGLPILGRLLVHIVAAIALVWSQPLWASDHLSASIALAVFTITAIIWMSNLFNFMDGANGLAGGMTAIGFGTYALAATLAPANDQAIALICASIAGSACGFLLFNFPVARVFMGDAGSIPIGFLAAAIGVRGVIEGMWPWWFGPLVFSPFIVDATVTITKRAIQRKKIWQAHREHYYQRLILSGWSHTRTTVAYYFLMLGSAFSALISQNGELVWPIALFWVITYALLIISLEWRFHQEKNDKIKEHTGAK